MTPTVPPGTPATNPLFPAGVPTDDAKRSLVLEQYKQMLQTIESLEARRQTLHTFFMSINTLLLAAIGLIAKESLNQPGVTVGIMLLAVLGVEFSSCWLAQIRSYEAVLKSKWTVFNDLERAMPSRPFGEEYALLDSGFVSFTKIECRVPKAFRLAYALVVLVGVLLTAGLDII